MPSLSVERITQTFSSQSASQAWAVLWCRELTAHTSGVPSAASQPWSLAAFHNRNLSLKCPSRLSMVDTYKISKGTPFHGLLLLVLIVS